MNKTGRTEIQRLFLIEGLPQPLTPASAHLQIFDNYITGTRLRLRSIRDPEKRDWTHILQQHHFPAAGGLSSAKVFEIHLNEAEYEQFKVFEGNEIRKNRYFHEFDGQQVIFDVFLGDLWGLNIAKVESNSVEAAADHEPPPFAVFEVTAEEFFSGRSLVNKKFEDVRAAVARLEPLVKGIDDRGFD